MISLARMRFTVPHSVDEHGHFCPVDSATARSTRRLRDHYFFKVNVGKDHDMISRWFKYKVGKIFIYFGKETPTANYAHLDLITQSAASSWAAYKFVRRCGYFD